MEICLKQVGVLLQKREILRDINLNLEKQQMTFLLGLNGAGKSTLIKAIMGLLPISAGNIYYNGRQLKDLSIKERARQIAYIPQNSELWIYEKVKDFILTGSTPYLKTFEIPKSEWKQRREEAMAEFQIEHLRDAYMDAISGGEKKLAYLARARVQDADWMILDEPTAALDYKRQHEFMNQLKRYSEKEKKGILLSVHDPNLALKYADYVVILDKKTVKACIDRRENDFENKLMEVLRQIYGDKLKLIEMKGFYSLDWREE